jgi:ABC-type uncharacterized transport system permease subunit
VANADLYTLLLVWIAICLFAAAITGWMPNKHGTKSVPVTKQVRFVCAFIGGVLAATAFYLYRNR